MVEFKGKLKYFKNTILKIIIFLSLFVGIGIYLYLQPQNISYHKNIEKEIINNKIVLTVKDIEKADMIQELKPLNIDNLENKSFDEILEIYNKEMSKLVYLILDKIANKIKDKTDNNYEFNDQEIDNKILNGYSFDINKITPEEINYINNRKQHLKRVMYKEAALRSLISFKEGEIYKFIDFIDNSDNDILNNNDMIVELMTMVEAIGIENLSIMDMEKLLELSILTLGVDDRYRKLIYKTDGITEIQRIEYKKESIMEIKGILNENGFFIKPKKKK